MADNVWSSAGSTDGNLAANWSLGRAPQSGDRLVFNATSVVNCVFTAAVSCGGINQAAGYTGMIDADTYDVTGDDGADFIFDGTRLDLGSGTWSVTNGTLDYKDVGTFNRDASTVSISGTSVLVNKHFTPGQLYRLSIEAGALVTDTGSGNMLIISNRLDLYGAYVRNTGTLFTWFSADSHIHAGGSLSGSGIFQPIYSQAAGKGLQTMDGSLTISNMWLEVSALGAILAPADYSGVGLTRIMTAGGLGTLGLRLSAGAYTFGNLELQATSIRNQMLDCSTNAVTSVTVLGDLTIDMDNPFIGYEANVTIDNSGQSVTWDIRGDVVNQNTSVNGDFIWIAGTADPEITFTGTSDQDIDFAGATVGKVEVDKSAGTVTLAGPLTCDSFTGTDGDLDMNGQTLTTTNDFDAAAAFTFNPADADSLNGCSIVIGGNLTLDGQALNATAGWTLTVSGSAVASGVGNVAYSDASGGTEVDASVGPWVDNGNNDNWGFGAGGFRLIDGRTRNPLLGRLVA